MSRTKDAIRRVRAALIRGESPAPADCWLLYEAYKNAYDRGWDDGYRYAQALGRCAGPKKRVDTRLTQH